MPEPSNGRDWSATDADSDTEHFAEYLEQATAFDQVKAYKARSHELLGLEQGDSVLDAGCGLGDDVINLAQIVGPNGRAVGIDNSQELIEQARGQASDQPGARFEVGDIYDLDFGTDAFDACRADRVLQHLDRPAEVADELTRVTRANGRLGLTDPDWESLVLDAPGEHPPHELLDPDYAIPQNPPLGRQLPRLARAAGLIDISVDAFVFTSTDFGFVYEMGEMDHWTGAMLDDSRIDQAELDQWLDRLRNADASGQFFGALPAYTVTGTVPE